MNKKYKTYKASELTDLSRRFKEICEIFGDDPKQVMGHYQALYLAEKQKQVFEEAIAEKRKKKIEQERLRSKQADSERGSEVTH
ncbi:hypothetical protein [Lactococcus taiwanensis]|uniref:hypothetical protein n=1 Tax=Lactococcus taiwanensis TaxID=1151742 RepID=UPI003510D774